MRTGRPTPPVVLTAEERQTLEQWARRPTTAQGLAQRARLVLACASNKTNGEIAAAAGVTRQTVGRWRHRFVRKRVPGLLNEPRPGHSKRRMQGDTVRLHVTDIRERLLCPVHRMALGGPSDDEMLQCPEGCRFETRLGIPRFVPIGQYAESFGTQWNAYRLTQRDSYTGCSYSRDRLERCLGAPLASLGDKLVLEVGAGAGRFTELLLPASRALVAVDASSAVEANRANCASMGDYLLIQADINASPLPDGAFDVVICLGVIQHTPSPEETIASLARHLAPGGTLVLDHYSHRSGFASLTSRVSMRTPLRAVLRRLARRHPDAALRATKTITAVCDPIRRRTSGTRLDIIASKLFPSICYYSIYPGLPRDVVYEWNELDTHDTLTDWFKHYRSGSQICATLERFGLEDITCSRGGNGVEARGRQPRAKLGQDVS